MILNFSLLKIYVLSNDEDYLESSILCVFILFLGLVIYSILKEKRYLKRATMFHSVKAIFNCHLIHNRKIYQ